MAQPAIVPWGNLDWLKHWDVLGTVAWIESQHFEKVTLQFPDELLAESTLVAAAVQIECASRSISAQVSVLADTSYNSLSVDEVAAQHAQADCVIHYGRASMSPLSRLPAYFVFGQHHLDTQGCAQRLSQYSADKASTSTHAALLVFLDQVLLHALQDVQNQIQIIQKSFTNTLQIVFANVAAQSMQPAAPDRSHSPNSQAAACSCKEAAASTASTAPSEAAPATPTCATPSSSHHQPQQPSAVLVPPQQAAHSVALPYHNNKTSMTPDAEGKDQLLSEPPDVSLATASSEEKDEERGQNTGQIGGYSWQLPAGVTQEECIMLWVGPDSVPTLTHLHLTFNKSLWVMYDPELKTWQEGLPQDINKTLKRRYFLVEKAKNASVIGILVGTLGVAGYQDAIESIRHLAKQAGKKTYTMLMGKPNPAKLANFPEVEIFVMVADPQGMILDSKEYYAPIITPYEAHLAFSGDAEWTGDYSLDFSSLQEKRNRSRNGSASQQPRFSLLDGSYHDGNGSSASGALADADADASSSALACRADQALQVTGKDRQVTSASEYLQKRRTYTGLEAPIVGAAKKAIVKAVQGQTGRAAQYQHEPSGAS
ncbi:hypothetical protein ABBQ38_002125 [Trebouxia sp. C0009 RCD-2024]